MDSSIPGGLLDSSRVAKEQGAHDSLKFQPVGSLHDSRILTFRENDPLRARLGALDNPLRQRHSGNVDRIFMTCQDCRVRLNTEETKGIHIIIPEGEMVFGEGDQALRDELVRLIEERYYRSTVDFSRVPYIDSSVLGQLVHGYSKLKQLGGL